MHGHGACAGTSLPLGVAYMARKLGHDLEEEDADGAALRAAATAAAAAALEQTGDSCGGDSGPPPPPPRRGALERPTSTIGRRGSSHRLATFSLSGLVACAWPPDEPDLEKILAATCTLCFAREARLEYHAAAVCQLRQQATHEPAIILNEQLMFVVHDVSSA